MRGVPGSGTEVHEEGLPRRHRAEIGEELDGAIGEVRVEMVALLGRALRVDVVVVVDQGRHPLVRLAAEEAIVALEAAGERPPGLGGARGVLAREGQVPLADGERGIALPQQDFGEKPVLPRHHPVVAGEPGRHLLDDADAVRMVVAPGQEARARRRADRGGVEVAIAEPAGRQAVDGGGADVGAEAADLREADVVEQHQQHVRRSGPRSGRDRPSGNRLAHRALDHPGERRPLRIGSHLEPLLAGPCPAAHRAWCCRVLGVRPP